jgi:hypothetical protein
MKVGDKVRVVTNDPLNGLRGVIVKKAGLYYEVDLSESGYMSGPLLFGALFLTPINVGAPAPSAMPSNGMSSFTPATIPRRLIVNDDTANSPTIPCPTVERDTVIRPKCPACGFSHESHYVGFSVVECSTYGCVHYCQRAAVARFGGPNG